ncbi:two-component system, OmpR family, sensor histidine kinase MtrB [Streptoalloteichus tenebrarius]|uniref:histidine kinase n=1 Tax=Streptoalloteichus tenebrarius (strain ATCC 17920 / DSM 40477 / JCM 4838 / CBS 697.72 / NBRC 16177 / NCIMB 11028 / NRRL B-12390 / A12253. 1 / ISP 5477) TaxID=1933 RepID=A0ABT1HWA2_STRSD|nr:HAMP domain-containing sensor histidine kinase [Streptoalloteichus tenebrarius]MCP2259801.1 two-component system, OmpR family, sensor histidine kinase MtrB [Streptoalloteichus tenebrarius]BFE99253.1 HAMP domain-containing sensor histidine kinase [Streptoalloteichus tenebrarius]
MTARRRQLVPPGLRGLRPRLVLAFVTVTVLGAGIAAWASYVSASESLVAETQTRVTESTRRQLAAVAPDTAYPPDQAALDRLRAVVGGQALVTYGGSRSSSEPEVHPLTPEIRAAVRERNRLVVQRVASDTGPKLLVGAPVLMIGMDGARRPSGIEVYLVHDLAPTQRQIDALARSAALTSAAALPLAVLIALLAARGVLRPVRELRDTARRLAEGDLGARQRPRGVDELAELTATFNQTAEALERLVARHQRMEADARRFVADVSHELRTPLTTLTAVVEVLESEVDRMPPDARASTALAVEETRKLTRLVEDLIEVSRFDAGVVRLRVEETDLRRAVLDCLEARGWRDEVDLDAPEGVTAPVDRRRLDVVVANLVGNALRHGAPPVVVRVRAEEPWVVVEVTDHGPGLPGDLAERVFERFTKADQARARSEGSGLGLAIARENARLHGGDIEAGNAPGGGARFVVRLPRRRAEEDQ